MDLSNLGRNDPCPCGSGKKFKRCHMGREDELLKQQMNPDLGEAARLITGLPACSHPRAAELAGQLEITSAAGRQLQIKFVDLAAYLALEMRVSDTPTQGLAGVLINPAKTRVLDPNSIYIAITPQADDSTLLHELAHALDLYTGSGLPPAFGAGLAKDTGLPVELLEHPQEYGDILIDLAQRFQVELDAEDEIVAFLARRKLLLPGEMVAKGTKEPLMAAAEKTMSFMQEAQDEIKGLIKGRPGYRG